MPVLVESSVVRVLVLSSEVEVPVGTIMTEVLVFGLSSVVDPVFGLSSVEVVVVAAELAPLTFAHAA